MTTGKREPPFGLDIGFFEALERFAGTDPKEVEGSIKRSKQKKPPRGHPPGGPEKQKAGEPSLSRERKPKNGDR